MAGGVSGRAQDGNRGGAAVVGGTGGIKGPSRAALDGFGRHAGDGWGGGIGDGKYGGRAAGSRTGDVANDDAEAAAGIGALSISKSVAIGISPRNDSAVFEPLIRAAAGITGGESGVGSAGNGRIHRLGRKSGGSRGELGHGNDGFGLMGTGPCQFGDGEAGIFVIFHHDVILLVGGEGEGDGAAPFGGPLNDPLVDDDREPVDP